MSPADDLRLLRELGNLLEQQIALARRGSSSKLEELALQADSLAGKIRDLCILDRPEHSAVGAELERLYKELYVILEAEKSATMHQINLLRRGKQTLEVYRENT